MLLTITEVSGRWSGISAPPPSLNTEGALSLQCRVETRLNRHRVKNWIQTITHHSLALYNPLNPFTKRMLVLSHSLLLPPAHSFVWLLMCFCNNCAQFSQIHHNGTKTGEDKFLYCKKWFCQHCRTRPINSCHSLVSFFYCNLSDKKKHFILNTILSHLLIYETFEGDNN